MTEPEKTVEDAPAMRPKLWFFKMFDQFSSSDVLSNYTRTYAWMANQLGHMALGLMTVFLFIWITETFETAHEAWRTFTAPGGRQALFDDAPNWIIPLGLLVVALVIHTRRRALRESGDLPPVTPKPLRWQVLLPAAVALSTLTMIDADLANFILLIVAVVVMLVVIPGICLMIQSATPHEDPETEREIRCARQVRLLSVVAFGGFALLLVARGGFEIEAETVAYADHRFAPMAVWMLFSVAVCLMKDVRFLLIVWIGAAISAFIATDGFYLGFRHNETLGVLEGFVAAGEGLPFDLLKGVACGEPFCANSFQRRFAGVLLAGMLLVVLFVTLRFGPFVPEMQDKLAMPGAQARRWQREGHGPTYLHGHELETRQDRRTVLMVGILGALYLIYVTWEGLEADWALAIGGAIMSMIVWFTKEFASDLPNVHTELTTATLARARKLFSLQNRMPKHSQIFAARTPKPMALAYFHDARWDSRTDGVFYFAGAWIAAGVVTESPVLTVTGAPGGWASGSEIVGILVFAAFFAFFGHNWILRQRAVDRLGTMRANRMAVFDARIEMWTAETGQPCEAPERGAAPWDTIRSLRILYDFARGWPDTDNAPVEEERRAVEHYDIPSFRHLIIFGRHGFGKAPLGAAIVTEATLADLTPRPTPTLSTGSWFGLMELLDSVRTGRMVDAATLCEYGTRERKRRHYSAREITAHPTRDLYFAPLADPEAPPPLADRLVTPDQGDEPAPFARAASLIAIDNFQFSLARRAMGGEQEALAELDNMFTALALHEETVAKRAEQRGGPPVIAPKQTVWMVRYTPKAVDADTDGADAEEEPEPAEILVFIEWLRGQLDRYSLPPEQRGPEPPAPGAIAYLRLSGAGSEI